MSDDPYLPYGRQWVGEAEIRELVRVLESDFLTTGPEVERFESALARQCGVGNAVAVASGTAALHTTYHAAGVGPGDEILTSPLTFAATANAALYLGATVRFVDVEPLTGTLDPDLVEAAIGPATRLIVPVDYAGQPADYRRIGGIAERHGLSVIADGSHSLGATIEGEPATRLARATVLSFHPVKLVTTAEGGAVVTDDVELATAARAFRTHGFRVVDADRERIGPWYTGMHALGFNYRLTDLQSALGRLQLERLDGFLERRRAIAGRYAEELAGIDGLELPAEAPGRRSAWHLYVVQVAADRRRRLFERLREVGLGVQVHYLPVYRHPYYRRNGYAEVRCPVAERRYERSISLPLYPRMSDDDVASVIARVRRVLGEER